MIRLWRRSEGQRCGLQTLQNCRTEWGFVLRGPNREVTEKQIISQQVQIWVGQLWDIPGPGAVQ